MNIQLQLKLIRNQFTFIIVLQHHYLKVTIIN